MSEQEPGQPTRGQLIEQAAQIVHEVSCKAFGRPSGAATPADIEVAQCLADAGLLADPEQCRPVVLLRAEDCACPVGGDCPHGPEPVDALDLAVWLHAERSWQNDELQLDLEKFRDYLGMANRTTERRGRELDAARAERDALQARLDEHEELLAAIWLYVKWRYVTKQLTTEQKNLWADAVEKISEANHPGEGAKVDRWWSAALQGDQPDATGKASA